jgi:hypothetical protein
MTFFWQDQLKNTPICKSLVENYSQIKEEVIKFVSDPDALYNYPKYNVGDAPLYENYWKAVPFSVFEGEFISMYASPDEKQFLKFIVKNAKQNCPTVAKVIDPFEQEGNLSNCFVSRLIPGSIINPHRGWTPDYMRIHLGLVCDPECKITVGTETQTWEEGKLIAFKDGGPHPHSVRHGGTAERIILSVDVKISYLQQFVDIGE